MTSHPLQGKVVIVTGSGGGLGKAIAEAYLAAGAKVTLCDINDSRLAETETEFKQTYPDAASRLHITTVDVTNEASVAALVNSTVEAFGSLDILVNNAGVMDTFDPVGECSKYTWDRVLGVNLTGTFLCSKAAVNRFLSQDGDERGGTGGLVINIGSSASFRGFNAGAAYTASKHAIVGLTKNTASFYGDRGVYCVALLLGAMVTTNISEGLAQNMNREGYAKMMAINPNLDPANSSVDVKDVAKYCVFLSDRGIAASSNGGCIVFNQNWPAA
ncbi:short chain dehydrogenase [Sodiomyces alkalinus F11]|uniref:Short chain dehydrogenase n=1 Tax=Sodiomyces alkalinus (strain CBS 110278 / VKM F-3762 / F11) TaxID=1314773 RepID=A0A3N2Q2I7_SODAK|nr:short chain dehydrogenase [Sodiomyces alkalinus F11]ROT40979.1 short chain dehydrogenase [Sodiomyces alkalinus F11]